MARRCSPSNCPSRDSPIRLTHGLGQRCPAGANATTVSPSRSGLSDRRYVCDGTAGRNYFCVVRVFPPRAGAVSSASIPSTSYSQAPVVDLFLVNARGRSVVTFN